MLWSNVNAIYQIYPRSFQDASGDGVGDIRGIINRIDYLKGGADSLGVDAFWLSPIFPSPMADGGYDVSDFMDVDPLFGSLADVDELITQAHKRNMLFMMDFVPNHTSSQHKWFQAALSSRDNPKRDYYIFRDPKPDGSPPNNWMSVFGGSAWQYHEPTGQYYMHSFLKEQPDLNWQNPAVQSEVRAILRFWLDRGVDGFRVDAIRWMGKNLEFMDDPINDSFKEGGDPYHSVEHRYSRYSPELSSYLRVMTSVVREYDNRIIIFEDHLDTLSPIESQVKRIYSIDPGVAAPFNFQAMHIPFGARSFSGMINYYQAQVPDGGRTYYCFSNHDEMRLATRFGERQARMLAVLQMALPGTPVLYYGQELGMTDTDIPPDKIQDRFELQVPGKGLGRDPERTPMQWSSDHLAGFSAASASWLPVNDNYERINVVSQQADSHSSLKLYQQLLGLRTAHQALRDGTYDHGHTDDNVMMFWRHGDTDRFLMIANFADHWTDVLLPAGGDVIVSAQGHSYAAPSQRVMSVAPLDGLLVRYSVLD